MLKKTHWFDRKKWKHDNLVLKIISYSRARSLFFFFANEKFQNFKLTHVFRHITYRYNILKCSDDSEEIADSPIL